MASITTRETGTTGVGGVTRKNLPLTNSEIDTNFINLNNDKLDLSNAVSANTVNTVVRRDASGNFSAGAITAGSLSLTTALPVTSGGTALSSSGGNGRLLIGNSSNGWTAATLTGTDNRITVTNSSGSITLSTPQDIATSSNLQFSSLGLNTPASGVAGDLRATGDINSAFSSDRKFKENIKDVPNALEIVCAIGSKTFDWTDEYINIHGGVNDYFLQKSSFGVIAQDVQLVFPQAVRTRENQTLAVDYEKLSILAFGAIKELLKRIEHLENK